MKRQTYLTPEAGQCFIKLHATLRFIAGDACPCCAHYWFDPVGDPSNTGASRYRSPKGIQTSAPSS